jgi:hypothetical protein
MSPNPGVNARAREANRISSSGEQEVAPFFPGLSS